jgi:hypothetical protein
VAQRFRPSTTKLHVVRRLKATGVHNCRRHLGDLKSELRTRSAVGVVTGSSVSDQGKCMTAESSGRTGAGTPRGVAAACMMFGVATGLAGIVTAAGLWPEAGTAFSDPEDPSLKTAALVVLVGGLTSGAGLLIAGAAFSWMADVYELLERTLEQPVEQPKPRTPADDIGPSRQVDQAHGHHDGQRGTDS